MSDGIFRSGRIDNLTIRCLYETILVNTGVISQVQHQSDVSAFRRFNGTDTTIMCRVGVTDFKTGTFAAQSTWAHRTQTAFVGELGKRVDLVHELTQLRAGEEFTDGCHHRTGVDKLSGLNGFDFAHRHT